MKGWAGGTPRRIGMEKNVWGRVYGRVIKRNLQSERKRVYAEAFEFREPRGWP